MRIWVLSVGHFLCRACSVEEPKDLWGVMAWDILARAQHGLHCSYSLVLPYRILMDMVSSEC